MKKTFLILCCIICIRCSLSAQIILTLGTEPIGNTTVITPTYDNLFKLLNASKATFVATMATLHYVQSKPDDSNTFKADNTEEVYNVDKEDKEIDIFFSGHATYAKAMQKDLLSRYPRARYKSMNDGIQAYYFEPPGGIQYCMLFDLPADGGGGVTLLQL